MTSLFGLVVLALDIFAIVTIVKSPADTGKKVLWILLVALLPVIGLILYFAIGNKKA